MSFLAVSRILASIFAVSGLADFLQQLYVKTQEITIIREPFEVRRSHTQRRRDS